MTRQPPSYEQMITIFDRLADGMLAQHGGVSLNTFRHAVKARLHTNFDKASEWTNEFISETDGPFLIGVEAGEYWDGAKWISLAEWGWGAERRRLRQVFSGDRNILITIDNLNAARQQLLDMPAEEAEVGDDKSDLDKVRDMLDFSQQMSQSAVKTFNALYGNAEPMSMDPNSALLLSINTQLGALCAVAEYIVESERS